MIEIKSGDICENCNEHPATTVWIGDGGTLAITRDYMQSKWCKCCCLKAQIANFQEIAKQIKTWEEELETACESI